MEKSPRGCKTHWGAVDRQRTRCCCLCQSTFAWRIAVSSDGTSILFIANAFTRRHRDVKFPFVIIQPCCALFGQRACLCMKVYVGLYICVSICTYIDSYAWSVAMREAMSRFLEWVGADRVSAYGYSSSTAVVKCWIHTVNTLDLNFIVAVVCSDSIGVLHIPICKMHVCTYDIVVVSTNNHLCSWSITIDFCNQLISLCLFFFFLHCFVRPVCTLYIYVKYDI